MRAFAQSDRFVSEVEAGKLRPAYVFVGDETFSSASAAARPSSSTWFQPTCAISACLILICPTPIWPRSSIAPERLL